MGDYMLVQQTTSVEDLQSIIKVMVENLQKRIAHLN